MTCDDFNDLLVRELPRIKYIARRYMKHAADADDVTQKVMLRALAKKDKFKSGTDFSAWLGTVTVRVAMNARRSTKQIANVEDQFVRQQPLCYKMIDGAVGSGLISMLDKLPPKMRLMFIMVDLIGLQYDTTAEYIGCPIGTVMSGVSRSRIKLRKLYNGRQDAHIS